MDYIMYFSYDFGSYLFVSYFLDYYFFFFVNSESETVLKIIAFSWLPFIWQRIIKMIYGFILNETLSCICQVQLALAFSK